MTLEQPSGTGRMKNLLATTFLSTFFLSFLPSIFLIVPIFLVSGALRGFQELKNQVLHKKKQDSEAVKIVEKKEEGKEEDSGIDASDDDFEEKKSEKTEESKESPKIDNLNLDLTKIFPTLNFVKISLESIDNLESLAKYLISQSKFPVLVTFRDIAILKKLESTPENTARLQYKKRKIKVVTMLNSTENGASEEEKLAEILLEIFQTMEKSLTWIYVFNEKMTAVEISEHRKLVNEIKKMAQELPELEKVMETKKEEIIDFSTEVIIPKDDGLMWFNSKL